MPSESRFKFLISRCAISFRRLDARQRFAAKRRTLKTIPVFLTRHKDKAIFDFAGNFNVIKSAARRCIIESGSFRETGTLRFFILRRNKMLIRFFLLGLLVTACAALALAQDEQAAIAFNDAALPRTAAAIEKFVPGGWMIEAQISGDLNNDAAPDTALKLIEKPEANVDKYNPPSRSRVLLILLKNKDGKFERAATAKNLLQCTGCGGAFYGVVEAPADVGITKGVLIIKQDHGSREVTENTYRFRYNPGVKKFALIGYDETTRDRATGATTSESANYLTGVKTTETFQYSKKLDTDVKKAAKKTRVSKSPQYLEQLDREVSGSD